MPTRYDSEDDPHHSEGGDREISLGTGTVLGIFLALALVCSLFFGLGYSMGRRSAPGVANVAASSSAQSSGSDEKPSSGRSAASREGSSTHTPGPDSQVVQPMQQRASSKDFGPSPEMPNGSPATLTSRDHAVPNTEFSAASPAVSSASPSAVPLGSQSFVQVAAVSRREDADLLLAALKRRGYAGMIRQQTLDNLLHVQVGPFPTKKDAEAMRQRLITDGYNPILK